MHRLKLKPSLLGRITTKTGMFTVFVILSFFHLSFAGSTSYGNKDALRSGSNVAIPPETFLSKNGQMFVVSSTPTLPTANIETPVLLLVNLSTNTKTVSLRDIAISAQGKSNTAWHLYLSPVVTSSGTAISPTNSNLGSSNVAQLQTWLLPSVSSFGKLFRTFVSGVNNSFIFTFNFSVIIPPGNSILFTGTPPSNNVSVGIDVSWSEEVF